jgi:hypothetical protein
VTSGTCAPVRLLAAALALLLAACRYDASVSPDSGSTDNHATNDRTPPLVAFTTQPSTATEGVRIPVVRVAFVNESGAVQQGDTGRITLALKDGTGTLSGTLAADAVQGVATFEDLVLDRPGSGFTLLATAGPAATAVSRPFAVAYQAVAVTAHDRHACAIVRTGEAFCWGNNEWGAIGDGTRFLGGSAPKRVAGVHSWVQLSAGFAHTCGIAADGTAYCWGANYWGELGTGSTGYYGSGVPEPVAGGVRFSSISAGDSYTCGLTAEGDAYCWGYNAYGELGDGTTSHRSAPTRIVGGLRLAAISARRFHTCGITAAGAAWCWGDNSAGQLGTGDSVSATAPVRVSGALDFVAISSGWAYTCGATRGGDVFCWGSLDLIANEPPYRLSSPVPAALRLGGVTSVMVSPDEACALQIGGSLLCWGLLGEGPMPDNSAIVTGTPTLVAPGHVWRSLGMGVMFNCGVASDHSAFCWGYNFYGSLGAPTAGRYQNDPVRVALY